MKLLIFTKKHIDKIDALAYIEDKCGVEYIPFNTNNLDQLLKIARFRIINFPTSIIIDNRGKVLFRINSIIPNYYITKYLDT